MLAGSPSHPISSELGQALTSARPHSCPLALGGVLISSLQHWYHKQEAGSCGQAWAEGLGRTGSAFPLALFLAGGLHSWEVGEGVCSNVTEGHTAPRATQRAFNEHTTCLGPQNAYIPVVVDFPLLLTEKR